MNTATTPIPFFEPPSSCSDADQCRTTWQIVRSCLATIFACTWVALHPNIPNPSKPYGFAKQTGRQAKIMVVALVAPEIIVLWACRQWFAAGEISKLYPGDAWTRTHSFFALMGGFAEVTKDPFGAKSFKRLSPYSLQPHLDKGNIQITEEEIKDRSKGDGLAKSLVLLQTTWFIVQFFTRIGSKLPVAEIELVTLAFATLSFATYFFWWDKPLNLKCVVEVQPFSYAQVMEYFRGSPIGRDYPIPSDRTPSPPPLLPPPSLAPNERSPEPPISPASAAENLKQTAPRFRDLVTATMGIIGSAYLTLLARPFNRAVTGSWAAQLTREDLYVPEEQMLYYYGRLTPQNRSKATVLFTFIAVGFGAMHCAGWAFSFPSKAEMYLWRVCSLIITVSPIYGFAFYSAIKSYSPPGGLRKPGFTYRLATNVFIIQLTAAVRTLYIIARAILLVEMFTLLRSSHKDVYESVNWTDYIPHV